MNTRSTICIVITVISCIIAGFLFYNCDTTNGEEETVLSWNTSIDTIGTAGTCSHPRVSFYEPKKANVVWSSAESSDLYSNNFNGIEWGGAVSQVSYADTFDIMPELSSNMTGVSFVIWRDTGGVIYSTRINGSEWGSPPDELTTMDESMDGPQDIACKLGSEIIAFAVWKETAPTFSGYIKAARYDGTVWSSDEVISGGWSNFYTKVAVDKDGNAIALLIDSDSGLEANTYTSGPSWDGPEYFTNNVDNNIESFNIAVGPGGVAMVAWRRGSDSNIIACRYDGSSWSTDIDISSAAGQNPEVSFDSNGNAIVVWTESDSIYSRRFLSTDTWPTWSEGKIKLAGPTTGMGECQIAADPYGNVFIVWDNAGEIHTKRYKSGIDWAEWAASGEVTVLDDNGGCAEPYIAVDMYAHAIAVWTRGGNIYSKRYF